MSTFFKLVPVMDWLADAEDEVRLDYVDQLGTLDVGYVADLDQTLDVDEQITERPTEVTAGVVSMIQLVGGRWFVEDHPAVHVAGAWWVAEEQVG